jgi:LDH2 family malate/lactate/ureidoglycolate dehydrogenase
MPTITADHLRPFSEAIFVAAGASPANAARVTEAMVNANLAGHDSHGVQHIPGYVAEIERGALEPAAEPSVLQESATTALVSGGWTFGHVGAAFATRLAIAKAREQHVAAVNLVEAHHIGRLGEYGEMGQAAGMIVLVLAGFGHRNPNQAPFGGARGLLGTNPMAIGIPAGERPGMLLDFATSGVAAGKVMVARAKGQAVPAGLLIDREGNPTTDPNAILEGGALLPFGGHKGFALALAIEFLGRVLGGGETYARANKGGGYYGESGTLVLAIDPGTFRSAADYRAAADDLVARVKAVPPAPGFEAVLVPGEPESMSRAARLAGGIPLPDSTWGDIVATAHRYGVAIPTL